MTFSSGLEDLRSQVPFLSLATHVPSRGALIVRPIAPGILVYTQWVNAVSDSGSAVVIPYRARERFDSRSDAHTGKYGAAKVVREYLVYVRGVNVSLTANEGDQGEEDGDPEDDAMVLTLTLNRAAMIRDYLARTGTTLEAAAFSFTRILSGQDKGKYLFSIVPSVGELDDETVAMGPIYWQRLQGLCQDAAPNSALYAAPNSAPDSQVSTALAVQGEPVEQYNYLLNQLLLILEVYGYSEASVISSIRSRNIDSDIAIAAFEDLLTIAILRWVGLQTEPDSFNELEVRELISQIDWTDTNWADQLLEQGSVICPWE